MWVLGCRRDGMCGCWDHSVGGRDGMCGWDVWVLGCRRDGMCGCWDHSVGGMGCVGAGM